MRYHLPCLFGLSAAFCVGGCATGPEQRSEAHHREFRGTVQYVSLEGGFYGIVTPAGEKLFPLNLPPGMRVDGLQVTGAYVPAEMQMGIQMWGRRVRLVRIEARQKN